MEKLPIVQPDSDFLIVIDIQKDLLPGGANAVPNGNKVLEPIFRVYPVFKNLLIAILTFFKNDPAIVENPYCVLGTPGMGYPKELIEFFVKGRREQVFTCLLCRNHNLGFSKIGKMTKVLRDRGCKRTFLCGLPLEENLKDIALNLKESGFDV